MICTVLDPQGNLVRVVKHGEIESRHAQTPCRPNLMSGMEVLLLDFTDTLTCETVRTSQRWISLVATVLATKHFARNSKWPAGLLPVFPGKVIWYLEWYLEGRRNQRGPCVRTVWKIQLLHPPRA